MAHSRGHLCMISGLLREGLNVLSDTTLCTLACRLLSCPQHGNEIRECKRQQNLSKQCDGRVTAHDKVLNGRGGKPSRKRFTTLCSQRNEATTYLQRKEFGRNQITAHLLKRYILGNTLLWAVFPWHPENTMVSKNLKMKQKNIYSPCLWEDLELSGYFCFLSLCLNIIFNSYTTCNFRKRNK